MGIRGGRSYRQSESFKRFILERDGYRCVLCGSTEDLQVDHIIPYAICKETKPDNCRTLCQKCNLASRSNADNLTSHLNGEKGARIAHWERRADPDGTMDPAERRQRALDLQREHLSRVGRNSWLRRKSPKCQCP